MSGRLPFIRLIKQTIGAIPPLRRMLAGSWRTGKLPKGVESINESIHDSVMERLGQRVIELRTGRSRTITYQPRNLTAALPEAIAAKQVAKPTSGQPRRVKVFTVHGTFAHDTDWDNWDSADDTAKQQRAFINRLAGHLKEKGIDLEEVDHTQYNWSGGNSHDERRVAAVGLKKLIQEELSKVEAKHGKDYYDKVFIVAHSHGGTISRLAMNLWDKDDDYYDPLKTAHVDEFRHDDTCQTCMRIRNGPVGRNSVRRPDGVITFGSPFVSFEKRRLGIFTAWLSAWVFRILAAGPLALILFLAYSFGAFMVASALWSGTPGFMRSAIHLAAPLVLYWFVASYLPRVLHPIERWSGKSNTLFVSGAIVEGVKYLVLAGVAIYYFAYFNSQQDRILAWLPVGNPTVRSWLGWASLLAVAFLVIVVLPGLFLSWLRREVGGLREKLPKKFDPAEDRSVAYVSYHTPGDEAGLHLRIFGVLTWVVQTLALSAASVLAVGIVAMAIIAIESALGLSQSGSFLNRMGISAVSDFPEFRDRFIVLMDTLTYLPKIVWSDIVGAQWLPNLGELDNKRDVAWFVPMALVVSILLIFLLLMPLVVVAITLVYLVSMWLRGSGVVFGSEKVSWNLASHIAVTRHANDNTALRLFFISPEAWWRREIAHSYYYKCGRVIQDVAERVVDWNGHKPTRAWPIEAWFAATSRLLAVLLFVFSVFALSIPIAAAFAHLAPSIREFTEFNLGYGPGSLPEPKDPQALAVRGNAYRARGHFDRALADLTKAVELDPNYAAGYNDRGNTHRANGDHDRAIADYTKAIELDPSLALALSNRGNAYTVKGNLDQAIVDYTKAIEIDPSFIRAYQFRSIAYDEKGDGERAMADLAKVVEINPQNYINVRTLGVAKYAKGDYKAAATDLASAVQLKDDLYSMLFLYLARTRAGETATAELEANASRLNSKAWPYAVAELYLGKRTTAATLDAATKPDERCEAQFYVGQWHILKNRSAEAANSLKIAVDTCPKNFIEYRAAIAELRRITR